MQYSLLKMYFAWVSAEKKHFSKKIPYKLGMACSMTAARRVLWFIEVVLYKGSKKSNEAPYTEISRFSYEKKRNLPIRKHHVTMTH